MGIINTNINRPLLPGVYYHIYNRGNNRENLFYEQRNYLFFLSRYKKYLNAYVDTYAYCLLPNHFHILIKVKELEEILATEIFAKAHPTIDLRHTDIDTCNQLVSTAISSQMRNLMNSYAKAINKQQGRVGSLFQKNFRRKPVDNDAYLKTLIFYIHNNPVHHQIHTTIKDYPHSSYPAILSDKNTDLCREEVIRIFEGRGKFIQFHEQGSNDMTHSFYQIEQEGL